MEELTKESLVAALFVLELAHLDKSSVFEFQKHLLCRDQAVHLLSLVSELSVLLTGNFFLIELSLIFLLLEFVLRARLEELQLFFVLSDRV